MPEEEPEISPEELSKALEEERKRRERETRPGLGERLRQIRDLRKRFAKKPVKPLPSAPKPGVGRAAGGVGRAATVGAQEAAAEAGKRAARRVAVQVARVVVMSPYFWIVVGILVVGLILILFFWGLFTSGTPYYANFIGGSSPIYPELENQAHKALFLKVADYTKGDQPIVEVSGEDAALFAQGENAILSGATEGEIAGIDIRLLKVVEYLIEDRGHEYLRIAIKEGAPDAIEVTDAITAEGTIEKVQHYAASVYGQALFIYAIDRTKIPELQPTDPSQPPPPIEMSWQRNIDPGRVRRVWEELRINTGVLLDEVEYVVKSPIGENSQLKEALTALGYDDKPFLPILEGPSFLETLEGMLEFSLAPLQSKWASFIELSKKVGLNEALHKNFGGDSYVVFGDKLISHVRRLKDALATGGLESQAEAAFQNALNLLNPWYEEAREMDLEELSEYWANPILVQQVRRAIDYTFVGLQVANIVNWGVAKSLDIRKAFEARSKIREVLGELKIMPTLINLDEELGEGTNYTAGVPFDERLIVRQIITWSPEDDLDDGLEDLDVFPRGFNAELPVDALGVNWQLEPDGEVTVEDIHFSHLPIDNGIFVKEKTKFLNFPKDEDGEPNFDAEPTSRRIFNFQNALYLAF